MLALAIISTILLAALLLGFISAEASVAKKLREHIIYTIINFILVFAIMTIWVLYLK